MRVYSDYPFLNRTANNEGGPRDAFVAFFGAEDGADPTEYHTGIPQVLQLMNSPRFNNASALGKIMNSSKGPDDVVEKLYLTVLSRRPAKAEAERHNTVTGPRVPAFAETT